MTSRRSLRVQLGHLSGIKKLLFDALKLAGAPGIEPKQKMHTRPLGVLLAPKTNSLESEKPGEPSP